MPAKQIFRLISSSSENKPKINGITKNVKDGKIQKIKATLYDERLFKLFVAPYDIIRLWEAQIKNILMKNFSGFIFKSEISSFNVEYHFSYSTWKIEHFNGILYVKGL